MRLKNKLARWQQAGLLSAEQHAAIVEYEQHHGVGWHRGLAFLGVFAIAIGVLSVIAANWQVVPPWAKLCTHLAFLIALAAGVLRRWERPLIPQICLLGWYGLTLSCIGLMGQVFHLAGSTADALLLWTALTSAAIVALASSALVLLPWLLGTLATLVAAYAEYASQLVNFGAAVPWLLFGAVLPAALALGAGHLAGARWHALNTQLLWLAGLLPVVVASLGAQLWYLDFMRLSSPGLGELASTLALAALALALTCSKRVAVPEWLDSRRHLRQVLLATCVIVMLPFLFPEGADYIEARPDMDWLAALSFIMLWLLLGWIGQRTQNQRLVSLAIALIALRLFLVYVEVFGSLLQTGFGLITSGALLLALLHGARKLSRKVNHAPAATSAAEGE